MKTGGFRDQISTKTHAAISFLKCAFKCFFPKVYFKSGPRVHRPPRFWATDRRKFAWHFACRKYAFWRSCLPRKESHTALILYFDWLMFYAKNARLQIFSSSWNQKLVAFHSFMLLYSGNPNHTIFNLGKTLLLFIRNCVLPPQPIRDKGGHIGFPQTW